MGLLHAAISKAKQTQELIQKVVPENIQNIEERFENNDKHTSGYVNIKSFGAKGDKITDDSDAIQAAVNYCESLIVKNGTSFMGAPKLKIPNGIYRITKTIKVKEAIDIVGEGFGTNIFLDGLTAGIWFVSAHNNWPLNPLKGDSASVLEGWQVFGGSLCGIRFISDRSQPIQAAVKLGNYDHIYLDKLWFWGIKGKCIEMQTVREHVINNIWCRYCGDVGVGNIETIQALPTQESTNLGLGNNWNIVNAYGHCIKFVHGQMRLHNFCFHGTHSGAIPSLNSFFPADTPVIGGALIDLKNASLQISKGSLVYGRDAVGYFKLDSGSINLFDVNISGFYTTADVNTNFIFDLYNSSKVSIELMNITGVSNGKIFRTDATTHTVTGDFLSRLGNEQLGVTITKKEYASNLELHGDYQKAVKIKPYTGNQSTSAEYMTEPAIYVTNSSTINTNFIIQNSASKDLVKLGYSPVDNSVGVVLLTNNTMFRLGSCTGNASTQFSNCMWIENGTVKVNIGGVIKTLVFVE